MPEAFYFKIIASDTEFFIFGKIENNKLSCYATSIEQALLANNEGDILYGYYATVGYFMNVVKPKVEQLGVSFSNVEYDTTTYAINDRVEKWEEYTLLE